MDRSQGIVIEVLAFAAVVVALAVPCPALDLVRNGKPAASIVIPSAPLPVETLAANELRYHVRESSGAELAIIKEEEKIPEGDHVYIGNCSAAHLAGLDPAGLPENGYIAKTVGRDLYILGKDGSGDPMKMETLAGTLFGVYEILEDKVGIHWLWPGKLGEVIPVRKNLSLPSMNANVKPLLWFKEWRYGTGDQPGGGDPEIYVFEKSDMKYLAKEIQWLRRQRFGHSQPVTYGHAFVDWWERFGATHPEWFNMMPDGKRGLDPTVDEPRYNHICVSNPDVLQQKVLDWKNSGMPKYFAVSQNDGWCGCSCPNCMAWDVPNPYDKIPFDQRLDAAKKAFAAGSQDGEWRLKLGSLSDRIARFILNAYNEASKLRPDVTVVAYIYDNYIRPPVKNKLNKNVLCGLVPEQGGFPYNHKESEQFRKDWLGWAATGCTLFLRPNYMLQGHDLPVSFARTLGEDLKFAMHHSMVGADFDSLTGQFAAQGVTLYMLPKMLNYPDASVDSVMDEYCSAFGPAKDDIREYFNYWEQVYSPYDTEWATKTEHERRKYGAGYFGFFAVAPVIYTPEVMSKGFAILEKARKDAAVDKLAAARVEWLTKGLKQADMTLVVARAYEKAVDSGDRKPYLEALRALQTFRAQIADDDLCSFAQIRSKENAVWDLSELKHP